MGVFRGGLPQSPKLNFFRLNSRIHQNCTAVALKALIYNFYYWYQEMEAIEFVPSDAATDMDSQMLFLGSDIYTSRHGPVQRPPSAVSH